MAPALLLLALAALSLAAGVYGSLFAPLLGA
jgi:hypothetical protein